MAKKLASVIVKGRWIIIAVYVILLGFSVWAVNKVSVNYDLSKYLPEDSSTRIALSIMKKEFGLSGQAEVMVKDITVSEALSIVDRLKVLDNVDRVTFLNTPSYFHDSDGDGTGHALFKIIINGNDYSAEAEKLLADVEQELSSYDIVLNGSALSAFNLKTRISNEMPIMITIAVIVVAIVLILTSKSWLDPLIYGGCIGVAILINMGTNLVFGEISYIIKSITAILQMAICLDYSIMIMHNYRLERKKSDNAEESMITALAKSFSPVSASAITTITGIAAIMFMTFRIGVDIGQVMVKAIAISMISSFLLMPALITVLAKPAEKLSHAPFKIKFTKGKTSQNTGVTLTRRYAGFVYKARKVVPVILLIVVVASYVIQSNLNFEYAEGHKNRIPNEAVQVFGESNQIHIITPKATLENGGYDKQREMIERLSKYVDSNGEMSLKDTLSYVTTIALEVTASDAAVLMNIDKGLVDIIYGSYFVEHGTVKDDKVSLSALLDYIVDLVNGDKKLAERIDVGQMLGAELSGYVNALNALIKNIDNKFTARELEEFVNSLELQADIFIREKTAAVVINAATTTITESGITYTYKDGIIYNKKLRAGTIDTEKKRFVLQGVNYSYENGVVEKIEPAIGALISAIYSLAERGGVITMSLNQFADYADSLLSGELSVGIDISSFVDGSLREQIGVLKMIISNLNKDLTPSDLIGLLSSAAGLIDTGDLNIDEYINYIYFIYGSYDFNGNAEKYKLNVKELISYLCGIVENGGGAIDIGGFLSDDIKSALLSLNGVFAALDEDNSVDELTALINELLSIVPNFDLSRVLIEQIYGIYYYDNNPEENAKLSMNLMEFINYADEIANGDEWSFLLNDNIKNSIRGIKYLIIEELNKLKTADEFLTMLQDPRVTALVNVNMTASYIGVIYSEFLAYYNDYTSVAFAAQSDGSVNYTPEVYTLSGGIVRFNDGATVINAGTYNDSAITVRGTEYTVSDNVVYLDGLRQGFITANGARLELNPSMTNYNVKGGKVYLNGELVTVDAMNAANRTFTIGSNAYAYRADNSVYKLGFGNYADFDINYTIDNLYIPTREFYSYASSLGADILGLPEAVLNLLMLGLGSSSTYRNYIGMTASINGIIGYLGVSVDAELIRVIYSMYYYANNPAVNYNPTSGSTYAVKTHELTAKRAEASDVILFAAKLLNGNGNLTGYYDADIYNAAIGNVIDASYANTLINTYKVYDVVNNDNGQKDYDTVLARLNEWMSGFGMSMPIDSELIRQVFIMKAIGDGAIDGLTVNGKDLLSHFAAVLGDGNNALSKLLEKALSEYGLTADTAAVLLSQIINDDALIDFAALEGYMNDSGLLPSDTDITKSLGLAYILYFIDHAAENKPDFMSLSINTVDFVSYIKALTTDTDPLYNSLIEKAVKEQSELLNGLFNAVQTLNREKDAKMSDAELAGMLNGILSSMNADMDIETGYFSILYALYAGQHKLLPEQETIRSVDDFLRSLEEMLDPLSDGYNAFAYNLIDGIVDVDDIRYLIQVYGDLYAMYKDEDITISFAEAKSLIDEIAANVLGGGIGNLLGVEYLQDTEILDPFMIMQIFVGYLNDAGKIPDGALEVQELVGYVMNLLENSNTVRDIVSEEQKAMLVDYSVQLEEGKRMFDGEEYSRIIFVLRIKDGTMEAFDFVEIIRQIAKEVYGEDEIYLAGNTVGLNDINKMFSFDTMLTAIISILSIIVILALIYRSGLLPLILVAIIQSAIWISFSFNVITGSPMFFMAYILITCIQMAATIDYGIILSSAYLENRKLMNKVESIYMALKNSMLPILTSGVVIIIAAKIIGIVSTSIAISTIGHLLSRGTVISVTLVLGALPMMLVLFDKLIEKTTWKAKFFTDAKTDVNSADTETVPETGTVDGTSFQIKAEDDTITRGYK